MKLVGMRADSPRGRTGEWVCPQEMLGALVEVCEHLTFADEQQGKPMCLYLLVAVR